MKFRKVNEIFPPFEIKLVPHPKLWLANKGGIFKGGKFRLTFRRNEPCEWFFIESGSDKPKNLTEIFYPCLGSPDVFGWDAPGSGFKAY